MDAVVCYKSANQEKKTTVSLEWRPKLRQTCYRSETVHMIKTTYSDIHKEFEERTRMGNFGKDVHTSGTDEVSVIIL